MMGVVYYFSVVKTSVDLAEALVKDSMYITNKKQMKYSVVQYLEKKVFDFVFIIYTLT